MLDTLRGLAGQGALTITHAYLGHIKKDDDQKRLMHAQACPWDELDHQVRSVLESHLYQMIEGAQGEVNFPCHYTGDMRSVAKVATAEYDRTRNRPAVEVLEAIRDRRNVDEDWMTEACNLLAYKVMSAGAISNHLVAVLRIEATTGEESAPMILVYATLVDLRDREESLLDERSSRFVTAQLTNAIKGGKAKLGALFPCLDEHGRELADMLIMSTSGSAGWFAALEATRRLPPAKEGVILVKMIAEQAAGGLVNADLFSRIHDGLITDVEDQSQGISCEDLMTQVERVLGYGINRMGFQARWETYFGSLEYRASFDSLFGSGEQAKPAKLKMKAGGFKVSITPGALEGFRQVTVGNVTFLVFQVPEQAKVQLGKDLDLHVRAEHPADLVDWMGITDAKEAATVGARSPRGH